MTADELHRIMPSATAANITRFAQPISDAMEEFGIVTPERMSMFLANVAHETGQLQFITELWGPTPAQIHYEGRHDLGNVFPGDGFKFRGRGLFQITGRANYKKCGDALGLDLTTSPELLEEPIPASRSAGWFWDSRNLNGLADRGLFLAVVKKINGGLNGLQDRQKFLALANDVFRAA